MEYVGFNMIGFVGDHYVVELEVEPKHFNTIGTVHGGVICALLDTAMARALVGNLPERKRKSVATLEMKVNFLKPIMAAGKLTAYGMLTNLTNRTAFVEGIVKNQEGALIAKSSATMMLFSKAEK
jgi:uncharacterized protein (TIGR00369 family)